MKTITRKLIYLLAGAALGQSVAAFAQQKPADYPTRPMRIIISVNPGAGADMVARMVAEILQKAWGEHAIVESRPGGGGVVASTYAARAEPDGYTMYQNGFGLLMQGAAKRVKFDVLKTFQPVVRMTEQPYILVVHPRVTANSIKDLIAMSKKKQLTYAGSSGIGSTVHIGMSQLAKESGLNIKYIPYKGSAPSLLALMGGEIDMAATSAMSAFGAIKTGKVRGLCNLGSKRVKALPDLPTLKEEGFNTVVANAYNLWVPAKTPQPIVLALNKVVSDGLNSPEYTKRLQAVGSDSAEWMSPADLKKEVAQEYTELEAAIKELGIKF
ncbi:MAG: Bug family tripartite tricarboxylate transporter substrate binding protein [Burkholderiales bacterium]